MREDNIESIYPLSPLQQGMLFHTGYDQKSSVYVESLGFKIRGNLDVAAFKQAWQKVIERHSALRTFFVWKNRENPLQIVRRQVELPWQESDWRGLPETVQARRLEQLLKDDQEMGFDLSRAPLQRLMLIQLSEEDYQFIWSYHHIILDGWSLSIVLDEVFSHYQSLREKRVVSQGHPQPYKEYINWLRQQDVTTAEMYWKKELQGFSKPTLLNNSEAIKKVGQSKYEFDRQQLKLSRTVSTGLQSLARKYQLTLNTVFQGAWAILLSRYSGESDILFGVAVSGRSIPLTGIESMVGLFIGSLPVRVRISPQDSLIPWLSHLQEQQVEARQFESSSLREIQAWSGIDRSQGQTLFDTILSFNNYEFDRILNEKTGDLGIHDVSFREGSHYPLTILIDPGQEIRIRINYDCSYYDSATVRQILGNLQVLIEDMAAHPEKPVVHYSLLTPAEKQKFLIDFNNTGIPDFTDGNVVDLFEEQVELNPNAVALQYDGQTLTYSQLNKKANQLAHHLTGRGIGVEQAVALCLDRSPEAIIAILGTLKAGSAYLPLDPSLPSKRLELMLDETESPIVLTISRLVEKLPTAMKTVLRLDADWSVIDSESDENPSLVIQPEDMAYIIYTSGSTGNPKGTIVRHKNLLNYISWARDFYLDGERLTFPLFSSLSFDLTVTSIFVPLLFGGCIVIYGEGESPGLEVLDVVREDRVDIIKLTPAHLSLLQAANLKSGRLRKMIVGGEEFKRNLAQYIHDLFEGRIEIYNEYGPTEATVGCMIHRFDPNTETDASVPIGRPIRNARIYILDQNLQPVPPGVIGEMCIGGAGVARGYLHRPQLTEAKFVTDSFHPDSILYRTGDLARWTLDGKMVFLGRSDHQVKIKGYRIELGEIESNLLDHPDIEAAVVTAFQPEIRQADHVNQRCVVCGLPDNFPGATFDSAGVCNTCREFSELKERFRSYFRTPDDLRVIAERARQTKSGKYDCIVLYSGGKDSTYMLYQLVREFGLQPLVFNLDNGYISDEAKANIRRVTDSLGVDLFFGQTPHMKAVFADSLTRHSNVCDGCFKVIYTLSINLARKEGIKYIFTGLSRGQLFETRLSDMFQARIFDTDEIDQTVLAARKAYHRLDDAVRQLMDVKIFEDDTVFDQIQLVDFYRYTDVPLSEMYRYLDQNAPWVKPSDTGRSTNCLINDVGIYIHKKERGFHNYALPYSWDVRVGHKTTAETVHELNDEIDQSRVSRILAEIGYDETDKLARRTEKKLVAYYIAPQPLTTTALRRHLSTKLPEYMIPADFIHLEDMPLTVNGKIDRSALPDPDKNRPLLNSDHTAPTTEYESKLVKIWSQVFRLEEIGTQDNFFELGGDSIISIQVVTKAKQAGLHFTPRDIFEQQTIARLALVVETDQAIQAEQGLVTGNVPLTPIQHWFFEQGFTEPQHWNQSIWLDVPVNVIRDSLQLALNHLLKQHDILRARFHQTGDGSWLQNLPAESVPLSIEFHDLTALPAGDRKTAMQIQSKRLESTLSLEYGPLLKAALFTFDRDLPMRLFVTCHHLVVDGVSWQPLLADWEMAYHQLSRGQEIQLPAKTTSFQMWANKLVKYAQSTALEKEIEYWRSENHESKLHSESDENGIPAVQTVSCTLDEARTHALLHEVHDAYNTNTLDLLLAAWVQAFDDVFHSGLVSVVLEGHGRDTDIIDDADLSHSVGWFTTQYPVHIKIPETREAAGLLKRVKEHLRRIPNKGMGYGLLRYLRADKQLASQPTPPVLFNFMGQFERALPASDLFTLSQPLQAGYSPQNRRTHALEVNSYVRAGRVQMEVVFNSGQFIPEKMQTLMEGFLRRLEELIVHCLSPDAGGHTPSDFALANMTDEQFNQLSSILNELDEG